MSDLDQALGVFFNTVVFEGLKTVEQTVEHLVPAVVEHLTTVIVPVVIFVDVNIAVPACTVFLNEFLKLTETAHFQERYKGVIFAGIVQNLGFVQDLKEPLTILISFPAVSVILKGDLLILICGGIQPIGHGQGILIVVL